MRAPPFPPEQMPPETRALHDRIADGVSRHLTGFVSQRPDGALVGPFSILLRFPALGAPTWTYVEQLMTLSKVPPRAREVAILSTAAVLNPRYEIYAHERTAAQAGLAASTIATVAAGQRPADLDEEEACAYDVASVLATGRQLPDSTYRRAVTAFGEEGAADLFFLVAGYCLLSALLNAYDISVPGSEEGLPDA